MNEIRDARAVPGRFWVIAGLGLLFEAAGCLMYWTQVSADPATAPIDQRAIIEATPAWINAAYAVAVWVGLAGAVLLLLRHRHAATLLLISLIAVIVQFGGVFLVSDLRELLPPNAFVGPIVIALIAYGLWHFARYATKRGWLR